MQLLDTIPQTTSTPLISFNPNERRLLISGESYPENSFEFYAPVTSWIKESLGEPGGLNLDIDVSYMNSSSTKCVLDILDLFEEAYVKGGNVSITWRYDTDNPRSLDLAEEFQEEVSLPFTIVADKE